MLFGLPATVVSGTDEASRAVTGGSKVKMESANKEKDSRPRKVSGASCWFSSGHIISTAVPLNVCKVAWQVYSILELF